MKSEFRKSKERESRSRLGRAIVMGVLLLCVFFCAREVQQECVETSGLINCL